MEKSGKRHGSDGLLDNVQALLIEVDGVLAPSDYCKKTLLDGIVDNVESYVSAKYDTESVQTYIDDLRKEAENDIKSNVEGIVEIPEKDESDDNKDKIVMAVSTNMKQCVLNQRWTKPVGMLSNDIIRDALQSKKIDGKVYDDVAGALKKLHAAGQKLYAVSKACQDTARLELEFTQAGDLSNLFSDIYGPMEGNPTEKETYTKLAKKAEISAEHFLLLTQDAADVKAAASAGFKAYLVVREGHCEATADELKSLTSIKSLCELFEHGDHKSPQKKHKGAVEEADECPAKVCIETGCVDQAGK